MMFGDFLRCIDHIEDVLLSPVLTEIGAKSDLRKLPIRLQAMGNRRRYQTRKNLPAALPFPASLFSRLGMDGNQYAFFAITSIRNRDMFDLNSKATDVLPWTEETP